MKTPDERIFSILLLAYPSSFRRRYREDLLAFFRAERKRCCGDGGLVCVLKFWGTSLLDLIRASASERLSQLGRLVGLGSGTFPTVPNPRRDERFTSMDTLKQDLRYAFRTLTRSPGFTLVTVATLALGIGTNVAMFSVVNGVWLRELPYQDVERIVAVWGRDQESRIGLSENERLRYREQSDLFEAVGTYQFLWGTLTGDEGAERVAAAAVDESVFPALGVRPAVGRPFREEETREGGNRVLLLSHDLWIGRYGGDPDIVGKTISVDGVGFQVVGVMPEGFRLPGDFVGQPVRLYAPLVFDPEPDPRNLHYLQGVARLEEGMGLAETRSRMVALGERLKEELPTLPSTFEPAVAPVREVVLGEIRPALFILFGSVALVLLIACINIANLFLARAEGRSGEISIRLALGGSRGRLVRQLMTESLVLAAVGGGLGLLMAVGASDAIVRFNPPNVPRIDQVGIDSRVVVFAVGISVLTALLFGLAPALTTTRHDLRGALHEGGKSSMVGSGRHHLRRMLVVSQIAVAMILAIGAGLLIKSFQRLQEIETGVQAQNVLTLQLTLPFREYPDAGSARAFYSRLLERVRGLPGVTYAGAITALPLASDPGDWGMRIEGREEERLASGRRPWADRLIVTEGYFEALGIELVEGRYLNISDVAETPQVVLINQTAAERYWPEQTAIGKRFKLSSDIDTLYRTVVGVVQDVKHRGLKSEVRPQMYLPHSQHPSTVDFPVGSMSLVLRTTTEPMALTGAIRQEVQTLDPAVPLAQVRTMDHVVRASTSTDRLNTVLFSGFGVLGLVLVSVGVYGVMSYLVTQRARELGIRVALGAGPRSVLRLVMGQGLLLALAGAVLGVAGALAFGRLLSGLLFGVAWNDVPTFLIVPTVVTLVALLACYLPARKATATDPMMVLRSE